MDALVYAHDKARLRPRREQPTSEALRKQRRPCHGHPRLRHDELVYAHDESDLRARCRKSNAVHAKDTLVYAHDETRLSPRREQPASETLAISMAKLGL